MGLEPTTLYTLYSRQSALPTELSWLGPNLTSHSTPDEQANHQLSMKEKANVHVIAICIYTHCDRFLEKLIVGAPLVMGNSLSQHMMA